MYFAIETQATKEIDVGNNNFVTAPVFLTSIFENGDEIVPVFLSRLHAYIFLKSSSLLGEFKLVEADDVNLNLVRESCREIKKSKMPIKNWSCCIVIGISNHNKKCQLAFFKTYFEIHDVFFCEDAIKNDIREKMGDDFHKVMLSNENLSDSEVIDEGNRVIAAIECKSHNSNNSHNLSSHLCNKFFNLFKTYFSRHTNSSTSTQNDSIKELKSQTEDEMFKTINEDFKSAGFMYLFILKNPDGNMYASQQDGVHTVLAFVNKLDAAIFSLTNQDANNFYIVSVNSDKYFLDALKKTYNKGKIKFRVALGFSAISTQLSRKWAKDDEKMIMPSLLGQECTLTEIENGFNIGFYFLYVEGKKEREIAISSLIKTNMTPTSDLIFSAKKMISDMKANIVTVERGNPNIYPRLIFAAI